VIFSPTALEGVFVLELERKEDERGFFARTWCQRELAAHGLAANVAQASIAQSRRRGTLRGLHYQASPKPDPKTVHCIRGRIHDVVVDLRAGSPTYRRWVAHELTADNGRIVYVPPGCAHGYQTLEDDCVVLYQISEFYEPELTRGVRWDDPAFGVVWPDASERVISARDLAFEPFRG
jgi:dTDP-4-dehydrorhamnose 3,5-epimerase